MHNLLRVMLICVVAGAVSSCRERAHPVLSPLPKGRSGQALSADGLAVHYTTFGRGEPALVFVHGWSCDSGYWKEQVPCFRDRHQVVTIDLGGHGISGTNRTDWTMEAFGKDVAAVVNDLALTNMVLIGHSMGGAVIIEAARLLGNRVRGLVGVDTFHDIEEFMPDDQVEAWITPLRENFSESTRSRVRELLFKPEDDSELASWVAEDMAAAPPPIAIDALEKLYRYDAGAGLETLNVPVRCIDCRLYPINVEAGSRHCTSFRVSVVPGTGHFLMLEAPDRFNRELKAVLGEFDKRDREIKDG